MTRDVAPRLGHHKTALIESRFFPALQVGQAVAVAAVQGSGRGVVCSTLALQRRFLMTPRLCPALPYPALPQGESGKMSASDQTSAVFVR